MNQQNLKGLNEKIALCKKIENQSFRPEIYRISDTDDRAKLEILLDRSPSLTIHDRIGEQLKELFKIRNPKIAYTDGDLDNLLQEWTTENSLQDYGVWVYYPWKSLLIHLVDREEFIELRTSRNQYKITPSEQEQLSDKIIGVIGLSVGQSVAVTMSIERGYGTIRVADFDTLELTNLNRIRRGLDSLGQKKTTMVAREIAEIDPFLKVEVFDEGINEENIEAFLTKGGKMDLLIEECDALDIKILSRIEAKKRNIPVLMDTSDRGMIDIERFDLEPNRPIFHGKIALDDPAQLKDLSYEEKIPFILDLIGVPQMSYRLKSSMLEVGESISTWPQLASDVTLGGAITAKIARQILLGEKVNSGRYYTEGEELWIEEEKEPTLDKNPNYRKKLEKSIKDLEPLKGIIDLDTSVEEDFLKNAVLVESRGNTQPWRIIKNNQSYCIAVDAEKVQGEVDWQAALASVGSLIRNIELLAKGKGLEIILKWFPTVENKDVVVQMGFVHTTQTNKEHLNTSVDVSPSNKHLFEKVTVSDAFYQEVKEAVSSLEDLQVYVVDSSQEIEDLANIASKVHIHTLLDKQGHKNYFNTIRWDESTAREKGDGYLVDDLLVSPQERMVLEIIKSWKVSNLLGRQNLGKGLGVFTKMAVQSSSAILWFSLNDPNAENIVKSGRVIQDVWNLAAQHGYAMDAMPEMSSFFNQSKSGDISFVSSEQKEELEKAASKLSQIFTGYNPKNFQLGVFRIGKEKVKTKMNNRKEISQFFSNLDDS
jgi:molybdopterin/thiamine biosynthesis adenylyltransferase